MSWYYLSFASPTAFLGACVVEADDAANAVDVATERGCNPGGEIMMFDVTAEGPRNYPQYTLMSREDMERCDGGRRGKTIGELEAEGRKPGPGVAAVHEHCNPVKTRRVN
jgi:hypothetical protein